MAIVLSVIKPFVRLGLKILSIALFVITLISAYGGRINPEYLTVPAVLTLALPYFAIATAIVAVAWFCFGRLFTAALGVLTLVASWSSVTTASPLHFSKSPSDDSRTFTLLSYNMIHGWDQEMDGSRQSPRTFNYIKDSGADIIAAQEVTDIEEFNEEPALRQVWDDLIKIYPYYAGTWRSDMKVFSKYPVKMVKEHQEYCLFEISTPWGRLNLLNIHLVSFHLAGDEKHVMRELVSGKDTKEGVKEMKTALLPKLKTGFINRAKSAKEVRELIDNIKGPLIVCGDMNDVPESYTYRMVRGTDLSDAYVETSFGPLITFNRYGFWFHLDQVLYRPDPLKALKVTKGKIRSSDHYPIFAEFEWEASEK